VFVLFEFDNKEKHYKVEGRIDIEINVEELKETQKVLGETIANILKLNSKDIEVTVICYIFRKTNSLQKFQKIVLPVKF
jgi:hypothetical protein